MGRREIEPGGEPGEARTILLHVGDGLCGNELGTLPTEQVGVGDHEVLDLVQLRELREILPRVLFQASLKGSSHRSLPFPRFRPRGGVRQNPFLPGIQSVPASGTPAMAAASMVRAQRSSGSRLWTWFLP